MLWSIDSFQNRVSADKYHLTVSRAQVSTNRDQVFFWSYRWQVTSFQIIAGSSLIFFKLIWNILCLCAARLKFWFQTDLGRENSASYYRQGRQLLLTWLTMVTRWSRSKSNFYALIGQHLTGEFMRKILQHLESCLLWQSFLSASDVFNCLFPLEVQNEMQLLSGVFCYSWIACLLFFWLRKTSLVKVANPFRMASFSFFALLDA